MGELIKVISSEITPDEITQNTAIAAAVIAHLAALDPHPQYLTPEEGDSRYQDFINNASGRFGQLDAHENYSDGNQPAPFGWTFIASGVNMPTSQMYRGKFGLGSQYLSYFLEIAITRFGALELWGRRCENGVYKDWTKLI